MTVRDIWGKIEVEKEYELIVNCKEFIDLKNKLQLGLNCSANANHTRYQHSLGVYHLVCKLINICKKKFSDRIVITDDDEKAFKAMALVHDIGHGCFSHVSERYLDGTHEERTIKILKDENSEIHQVLTQKPFGQEVLDKVLDLIQMKERIKNRNGLDISNNLMLIIGRLLSGGIDVDRIDYIYRDSKNVVDEDNDYSEILNYIDLEFVDDSLEVVFDERAEYSIANFFNKRFELYDTIYCSTQTRILERIFDILLKMTGFNLTWETTEIELNNFFRECCQSANPIIRRYAQMLSTKTIADGIMFKEMNNSQSFDFNVKKIMSGVPDLANYSECIFLDSVLIDIYKKKNKVYIKKGGLIKDISECSKILNSDLVKERHVLAVDLYALEYALRRDGKTEQEIATILKKVKKALSPEIEQEKKYTFNELSSNPKEDFKKIVQALKLQECKFIENYDDYYDDMGILSEFYINLRKRSGNEDEWTLKRPVKDNSSISKRDETNFSTKEEALEFLKNEWGIALNDVRKELTIKTKRAKYKLECYGGVFEIVFDCTIPIVDEVEYPSFYMIECELKSGNSSGLYFINQQLKEFKFIDECNHSKKEIAESIVKSTSLNGPRIAFFKRDR